ncbi:MAG: YdeI/OmpD-associated family protein [Pseudomonadota bacterium]
MSKKRPAEDLEQVEVKSRAGLRARLTANHHQTESIWLITYKKAVPDWYVDYDTIVEECLCFGWVDSLTRAKDDQRSMLLLAPRKTSSAWSGSNKRRVEKLLAAGLMESPGLAKIEAAKANGMWTFLDDVEAVISPPDLVEALERYPDAKAHFDAFPRSPKRGILEWIKQAKKPETRAKRIEETASLAQDNTRANQLLR